ncbi:3-hydroxyacyl-CoA dehydrogenase family protein [Pelosinus propionicus]|uniref:3-hydroxybutyryl-CoA dehydrogenase n=1 Tax=Pelosinus propionicus DSM 13327 TaxID=1123291 RepID=A0A1I4LZ96_9FIRM|nr:3-hydroxyacyl-CoA dehydrogenase family protein [Pelosinus propionicus]SFL96145.1 3-hydroxybutyryl-CoA dehydrogenase [Pelosinus propionicus DSM 13327]
MMIKKIAVLGSGTMGHGIAEAFAMYGYEVNLYDTDVVRLQAAKKEIKEELELLVEEGFIATETIQPTLDRINLLSDLKQTVADRDYVIEAVPEVIKLKQDLFKQLDEYCPEHTILTSNTSSLSLVEMMALVSDERKQKMMVSHWYNPGHLMPLVELSYFGNMPEKGYKEVEELYASIKKQTVKVLKDVPGLVANRIQQGVAREAFSIIELGIAAPEDVDKALKFGPAFRYATTGQLEVADFGGLDIWCIVGDNLLKVIDNSQSANNLLRQKVAEGKLGIKSGEGFFKYNQAEIPSIKKKFMKKLIHQLKASHYYI